MLCSINNIKTRVVIHFLSSVLTFVLIFNYWIFTSTFRGGMKEFHGEEKMGIATERTTLNKLEILADSKNERFE